MTGTLRESVVAAYGGAERWREANAVESTLSAGGLLFRWKRGRAGRWPQMRTRAEIHEPLIRMDPFDRRGNVGILEGHDPRLETPAGQVVESRRDAHENFPYGRRLLYWDSLDMVYFLGHALWNYLVFPGLLLRDDIDWQEVSDTTLEARFPPHLPTHNPEAQQFHFDPDTHLLRQYDYVAKTFGNWAVAAHMTPEHGTQDGIPFPSKRRVKPRDPVKKAGPLPFPLLIWADVHEHRLV
jgi:hypothetical protein